MDISTVYDPNGILQEPTLILTTRSAKKLGALSAKKIVYHRKENDASEISFDIYRCDVQDRTFWEKIRDLKLAYVKEFDQFFELTVEIEDGDGLVKHVQGKSLGHAELSQILLRNIQINTEDDILRDDYEPTVIYNELNPNASLLTRILEKAPHWGVAHVDSSIARLQRQFTFDCSIQEALNKVAEEVQCIVHLDAHLDASTSGISRTISLYDLQDFCMDCGERGDFTVCPNCGSTNVHPGYGEDTSIFVSVENLADSINYNVDVDSVKNCFRLEGGDDLMTAAIAACNPNGSQYIWYISEEQREDMSDALKDKLEDYDELYDYYQNDAVYTPDSDLRTAYNAIYTAYASYDENLTELPASTTGHAELMEMLYGVIDMKMFLSHNLLPDINPILYTADDWADWFETAGNFSTVAVLDLAALSQTTATSTIITEAKAIVGSQFKVTAAATSFENNTWVGTLTFTNIADEEDTATTTSLSVTFNSNYEQYVKQKIDRILANANDDKYGIADLLSLDNNDLEGDLKSYSLSALENVRNVCQGALDILIQQGCSNPENYRNSAVNLYTSLYLPYYQMYTTIEAAYAEREEQIAVVDAVMNGIYDEINTINGLLDFQTYIGDTLWTEFAMYRREDSYKNDNYISDGLDNAQLFDMANQFVETARKDIIESATAQHKITAKLKNLLTMEEFRGILSQFGLGNWIRVKTDEVQLYRLRVTEYSIEYDNPSNMEIAFSDVKVGADSSNDFDSIIKNAASMSTSYGMVARQASKGEKSMSAISNFVENGLYLTNTKILNTENQDVQIDEHGILGREFLPETASYDPRQIRIINRGFYMTDDAWETSQAAIGEFTFWNPTTQQYETRYGVIADVLTGNLILGQNVGVYNESGSISLGDNGFILTTQSEDNETVFTIQKATTESGVTTYEPLMTIDSNGNIVLHGNVNLNMQATQKPEPFTNDTTLNEFYSSVVANANQITEQFTQVSGMLNEIRGEICRGFVTMPDGKRYFGIVISQEKCTMDEYGDPQYTVPDGVTYYSDTSLSTVAGTTTAPYDGTGYTTTYVSFTIGSTTYYADITDCLYGYVHYKLNPDDTQWYYEIDTLAGKSYGLYTANGWSFWNGATEIGWFDAGTNKLYVGDIEIITTFTMSNWVMTTKKRDVNGALYENGFGLRYIERDT